MMAAPNFTPRGVADVFHRLDTTSLPVGLSTGSSWAGQCFSFQTDGSCELFQNHSVLARHVDWELASCRMNDKAVTKTFTNGF
jgi:hypothetical protein